jgi:hypothetical protein
LNIGLVHKIREVVDEVAREKGPIDFAALLLREGSPDRWDLVISGPWTARSDRKTLEYVSARLRTRLSPAELVEISHIELLEVDDEERKACQRGWISGASYGYTTSRSGSFKGVPVVEAYYLISEPPDVAKAAPAPKPSVAPR